MSQWKCKTDDGELGLVSFKELAELVRQGKLKEGALVCREGASNWEPAWHVPGLLRAAGIVEPGDSPAAEGSGLSSPGASGFRFQGPQDGSAVTRGVDVAVLPGLVTPAANTPVVTLAHVVRGVVAAAVGVLAVGFFYRWASQAMTAFPMPPAIVDGELIDCYFPMIGRCTMLECGLLYVDVFAVAAVATWHAVGKRVDGSQ